MGIYIESSQMLHTFANAAGGGDSSGTGIGGLGAAGGAEEPLVLEGIVAGKGTVLARIRHGLAFDVRFNPGNCCNLLRLTVNVWTRDTYGRLASSMPTTRRVIAQSSWQSTRQR